ncbi:hypothetical protein CYMTET_31221 [Cymbomonas tetramitiformis]|uniref:Uncharacterized protein n=1 Tax=Cymbomonas tetramitiformis TaxID=36881 RepID=A0AAE0KT69_9CHLO|nr:hypothetical protein CYMTET_31221 [Cymbomonas tetramitiformis]
MTHAGLLEGQEPSGDDHLLIRSVAGGQDQKGALPSITYHGATGESAEGQELFWMLKGIATLQAAPAAEPAEARSDAPATRSGDKS